MSVGSAIVYYLVRLVIFTAVAAAGIALGIKLRKRKNEREQTVNTEE